MTYTLSLFSFRPAYFYLNRLRRERLGFAARSSIERSDHRSFFESAFRGLEDFQVGLSKVRNSAFTPKGNRCVITPESGIELNASYGN